MSSTTIDPASTSNPVSGLLSKIEKRQVRVAIIGLGYVGLPLALLYTEQKFRVTGFDIDERKVSTLTQGGSYIVRILPSEIQRSPGQGIRSHLGLCPPHAKWTPSSSASRRR